MIAIVYAVYAGIAALIAALIAGITMIMLGPSGLEPIAILAVGLASPLVAPSALAVIGLASEQLRHQGTGDRVGFMVYLTVPVIGRDRVQPRGASRIALPDSHAYVACGRRVHDGADLHGMCIER
jgi:hypothetical protein